MRLAILLGFLLCSALLVQGYEDNNFEDDDFAEFEQFEGDDESPLPDFDKNEAKESQNKQSQGDEFHGDIVIEDDLIVEDEDNEFEHFQDPEEFEGFNDAPVKSPDQPKITITEVPITKPSRWDAYWLEGIFCCILVIYATGYLAGRSKNTAIALNFLKVHKPLLDDNFTLVGEMGSDIVSYEGAPGWRREAEHVFTMWCSGRICCEGMLLTLKLIKRQDLVHALIGLFRPSPDTLQIRVELGKEDGDPFVLCVAQKKLATKLAKEMQDLSVFCPEKRPGDKHGLPASLAVLSESAEATAAILDSRVTQALNLYHKYVQYIHISDKFCGPKIVEETAPTQPPETERVMLVSYTIEEGSQDELRALLCLTFYLTDKIKRLHLSKESLAKCEKRRQKVSEMWMKGAHAARQEQAAARREEKRKQEKERILAEDDPEKQRRWELKEQKRQAKRKTPKMKQLKVKAL